MSELPVEPISTGRLLLEPLAIDHAEEMARALADASIHAFIGGSPATAAELRARYARLAAGSGDPDVTWLNWVIRLLEPDCLVGTVQATVDHSATHWQAEVAWVVGVPWQCKGIATEAAGALIDWLRRHDVRTIVAHIHPDHTASAMVASRTGLSPTDVVDDGEVKWQLGFGRRPRRDS